MEKEYTQQDLMKQLKKAHKARKKAIKIAKLLNEYEGYYYSTEQMTPDIVERYFEYHADKDPETVWVSSSLVC